MNCRILVVDDEPDMLSTCKAILSKIDVTVVTEERATDALARIRNERFDLILADIKMPGMTGMELLKAVKDVDPDVLVIIMTAYPDFDTAVQALRLGALDYVTKPVHPADLLAKVQRALVECRLRGENRLLKRHVQRKFGVENIVGSSPALLKMLALVDRIATTPADVLILGESGTGKELVAKRIHDQSRQSGHFVPFDCGAIPEHLLENELFGHERGAYTDASSATPGLLEFAHRGTFFLDEVCELPLALQAKLLRTLQERQFRRVGAQEIRSVDIRVVAATNRDIHREVREGRFREELYYRLNVVTVQLPPLRERSGDVRLLVDHYLPRFSREFGKTIEGVEEEACDILSNYVWPGNVRELQNVLKKAIVICDGETIRASDLPEELVSKPVRNEQADADFVTLKKHHQRSFENEYFSSILKKHRGSVREAAEEAGLPLSNFYWYLKKLEIKPDNFQRLRDESTSP